jgi:hypothetical protein
MGLTKVMKKSMGGAGRPAPMRLPPKEVYTIAEFCEAYGISRSYLHELWKEGNGPPFITLGRRRFIRIVAARAWAAELEQRQAAEG